MLSAKQLILFLRRARLTMALSKDNLEAKYLPPFSKLNKYWDDELPDEHIHVLIERLAGKYFLA
jgi:hypothetical protein